MDNKATLYIVATPIGNLGDFSPRAVETLKSVDAVLCEDTRVTRKLLTRFGIEKPTLSYHQHSSLMKTEKIIGMLESGKTLALVSDAGTPGIADPGGKLVSAVIGELPDVAVVPIPGPSALISALSVSGFAADSFVFLGWPPHKKGRETFFRSLTDEKRVVVFYESVHRIRKALESLSRVCPNRCIVLCRELTKKFESVYRGTASSVLDVLSDGEIRGEFVVVINSK